MSFAARIPRAVPKSRRKPNPRRAAAHLAFVRAIGICLACGAEGPCQAAHVRSSGDAGIGIKPADRFSLPLCAGCHFEQHRIGEPAFYGRLGIDALDVTLRLWCISGDTEQGRRCIERARARMRLSEMES